MTVATNALLERRGARTALVTTEGFRDVLEIARQNRPSLYDLAQDRPPPLVPRELRFTVEERMGPEGEVEPLDEDEPRRAPSPPWTRPRSRPSPSACSSRSRTPNTRRRVGEALREALPDVHVSLSSEVLPEFREYERFSTTAADAYLAPRLAAYLENLAEKVEEAGVPSAPDHAVLRRGGAGRRRHLRRRRLRPLGSGGGRRRRRLRRLVSAATRTSSPSTWAVRARTWPRSSRARRRRPRRRSSPASP